jgi:hypothetical protein
MIEFDFAPDERVIDLLTSLARDVFPMLKKLPRGNTSLEDFDNQPCDFEQDVALGLAPRDDVMLFMKQYAKDARILEVLKIFSEDGKKSEFKNFFYYPPNSMMTWHTNSNAIGTRVYYTLLSGGDIFRYRDPLSKEVIDVHGKDGWNVKRFKIGNTKEDLMWHTLYAKGPRFSFGFNLHDG